MTEWIHLGAAAVVAMVLTTTMPVALAITPDEEPRSNAESSQGEAKQVEPPPDQARQDRPVYTPPRRGAPITRVGGGTRSLSTRPIELALLSPPHTGLTTHPSPTLYWYVSESFDGVMEFVVTEPETVEPLLKHRIAGPVAAGIQPFDLAEHRVTLAPNRVYQWSVAIIRDPERRSHDIVSIATIERVSPDAALPRDDVSALAGAGLWYDAMEALHRTLRSANGAPELHRTRADLLDQAELPTVAAWDRGESCAKASC